MSIIINCNSVGRGDRKSRFSCLCPVVPRGNNVLVTENQIIVTIISNFYYRDKQRDNNIIQI